ncbi:MAG: hypothetical protein KKF52_01550 [Nanoarchaeota archaeon]|nr:hypothetical protein [Nanoarchaeota archaeon]MBU4351892.1 hypothetical protein [Nanoarchaeota archaeon]
MKISKILVLIVFVLILSLNVLAADNLVWKTVDGKPTVQSFNALDSGTKYETEPSIIWSIIPFGEKEISFIINANNINANTGQIMCEETCVIYTGFEKTEAFKDKIEYTITSAEEYSSGKLIINKISNEKLDLSDERLLNEEIAFEPAENACSTYKSPTCFHYKINSNKLHTIRLTNAKVTFDNQGNIKLINGLNRKGVETAWIDGLGIPLTANDGIDFSTNEDGKTDFSKLRLIINPDVTNKEKWLKNLPKELKDEDEERSKINLCGYEFTNYYSDSNFVIEKTEKGCSLKEYTLNTELFVEADIKNWKEFEYQCGELKFQAMGGKLNELKCTVSEDTSKNSDIISVNKGNSNNQMFRMKLNEYWFSINEKAGLQEIKSLYELKYDNKMGMIFKTKELRVAHDIPNTGGPLRYKGDLIKTTIGDEDSFITFAVPGDSAYKKVTNYLEPQIQVESAKINEISRKIKSTEYSYSFQKPFVDYILQLGNDLNRGPIVAIFPTNYNLDDNEVTEIINYKGKDILTFGVDVWEGINLGKSQIHNYILQYDPNYKSKKKVVKTESQTEKVEGEVTIGEYVAQRCYGQSYSELNKEEKDNVYDNSLKLRELNSESFDLGNNFVSGFVNPNLELNFPGTETTTFTNQNGNTVRIKPGLNNCPRLSAENIKETLSEKKSCIVYNGEITGICTKKEECNQPITIIPVYSKTTILNKKSSTLETQICQEDYVCCRTDKIKLPKTTYQKKSQLPIKKGRIRDDSLCTKLKGKCAFATENSCINEKTGLSIKWLTNKCLSNSNRNYICCTGTLEKFTPNEKNDIPLAPLESGVCIMPCDLERTNGGCIELRTLQRQEGCGNWCAWRTEGENTGCYEVKGTI